MSKSVELNREKLIAHLEKMWKDKWDGRIERPRELAEWFYGPGPLSEKELDDMRKLYTDAYIEGAQDMLRTILTFDDDIRGVEAIAALGTHLENAQA